MAEVNNGIEMGEMTKLLDSLGQMGKVMKKGNLGIMAEKVSSKDNEIQRRGIGKRGNSRLLSERSCCSCSFRDCCDAVCDCSADQ